jgi:hypothetical protein
MLLQSVAEPEPTTGCVGGGSGVGAGWDIGEVAPPAGTTTSPPPALPRFSHPDYCDVVDDSQFK